MKCSRRDVGAIPSFARLVGCSLKNMFVAISLVFFSGAIGCYIAAAKSIRNLLPIDWKWTDRRTLDANLWGYGISATTRRLYFLSQCLFAIGSFPMIGIAVERGDYIGTPMSVALVCVLTYRAVRIWLDHRQEL